MFTTSESLVLNHQQTTKNSVDGFSRTVAGQIVEMILSNYLYRRLFIF